MKFLRSISRKNKGVIIPGYTHMRKAMPSSIEMYAKGFAVSMKDNLVLLDNCIKLIDKCPLGSGAGYGIPIVIDKEMVALANAEGIILSLGRSSLL